MWFRAAKSNAPSLNRHSVSPRDSRAGRSCHAMVTRRVSEEPTAIPRSRVGLPINTTMPSAWLLILCLLGSPWFVACNRTPAKPVQTSGATSTAPSDSARQEPSRKGSPLQITQFVPPNIPNPGYVGPQACSECHRERVEECMPTSHFRTCRVPDVDSLARGFEKGLGSFRREGDPVEFQTFVRGNKLVQATIEPSANGTRRLESSIDLIYGANPISDEVYLSWRPDESMWELPVAWVYAKDCWGASGFDRDATGDRARELTLRCFECHNTWFQHIPGTTNVYRRKDMLLGVTCERCHGPGQSHVEFHQKNPEAKVSQGIVYPGGLPRERLIEVCTQCHSNAIRHRGPALSYRPGDELEKHYRFAEPPYSEDDHVANQIKSLRQSKCFQNSEMTCITCHDPHKTAEPVGERFHDSCLQCHTHENCGEQSKLPTAVREKCSECHMRKYVKVNVNFDLVDDSYVPPIRRSKHNISIDPVATHELLLENHLQSNENPEQTAEAARQERNWLVDHWAAESKACLSQFRFTGAIAALRESLRIDSDNTVTRTELRRVVQVQTEYDALLAKGNRLMVQNKDTQAIEAFQSLLKIKPTLAEAYGRLGTLYAKRGLFELAKENLNRANQLDPDDQYGHSMLARLAFVSGDLDAADKHYSTADSIEPYNSKLHLLWGQVLRKANRISEAMEHWNLSVQIDPRQVEAHRGLCELYLADGKFREALPHAKRLCELTRYESLGDLMMLAEIHIGLGESEAASSVGQHGLLIARRMNAAAADEIAKWLGEHGL